MLVFVVNDSRKELHELNVRVIKWVSLSLDGGHEHLRLTQQGMSPLLINSGSKKRAGNPGTDWIALNQRKNPYQDEGVESASSSKASQGSSTDQFRVPKAIDSCWRDS